MLMRTLLPSTQWRCPNHRRRPGRDAVPSLPHAVRVHLGLKTTNGRVNVSAVWSLGRAYDAPCMYLVLVEVAMRFSVR